MVPGGLIGAMLGLFKTSSGFWNGVLTIGAYNNRGNMNYGYENDAQYKFGSVSPALPDGMTMIAFNGTFTNINCTSSPSWKTVVVDGVSYPVSAFGFANVFGVYSGQISGNIFKKTSGTSNISFTK